MPASENRITVIDRDLRAEDGDTDISMAGAFGSTLNVTNATNASPIVITTSAAHGYVDGLIIEIAGVAGNLAANGIWVIDVLTTTTFSLLHSTGSGAYVSGGTAQRVFAALSKRLSLAMMRLETIALPWNLCSSTGGSPSRPRRVAY